MFSEDIAKELRQQIRARTLKEIAGCTGIEFEVLKSILAGHHAFGESEINDTQLRKLLDLLKVTR